MSGMVPRVKILNADDHPAVRTGTRKILECEGDFEVVAEAGDGREAVILSSTLKPDIAIVDIAMPEMDGIEVTRQIRGVSPNTAVLILTILDDAEFVASALEAGAAGYLLKSVRQYELIQAVRQICTGFPMPSGSVLWQVLDRF